MNICKVLSFSRNCYYIELDLSFKTKKNFFNTSNCMLVVCHCDCNGSSVNGKIKMFLFSLKYMNYDTTYVTTIRGQKA
jgi:hypothetical protein